MFKIEKNPQFTHDVMVMMPVDGGFDEQTFKCRYRLLPAEEVDEFNLNDPDGIVAFLEKVIVSFSEIIGEDDKELPYNDALRDQVLGIYNARMALRDTYVRAVSKAKAGN